MSNLPVIPLQDLRLTLLGLLQQSRESSDAQLVHLSVSMLEYLRDAERWHHVAENTVQWNNFEPRTAADFRKWVDQEIHNEQQRFVCARQGRVDGVPGNSGTGGASNPVI